MMAGTIAFEILTDFRVKNKQLRKQRAASPVLQIEYKFPWEENKFVFECNTVLSFISIGQYH